MTQPMQNVKDFNRWRRYIAVQRWRCQQKLALMYNDQSVVSEQERERIADRTRVNVKGYE
jgi:hypothetical protein